MTSALIEESSSGDEESALRAQRAEKQAAQRLAEERATQTGRFDEGFRSIVDKYGFSFSHLLEGITNYSWLYKFSKFQDVDGIFFLLKLFDHQKIAKLCLCVCAKTAFFPVTGGFLLLFLAIFVFLYFLITSSCICVFFFIILAELNFLIFFTFHPIDVVFLGRPVQKL